jgi:hypothetical protein
MSWIIGEYLRTDIDGFSEIFSKKSSCFKGIRQSNPVRNYLCSMFPGLANFPINRIGVLTPAAWLARN